MLSDTLVSWRCFTLTALCPRFFSGKLLEVLERVVSRWLDLESHLLPDLAARTLACGPLAHQLPREAGCRITGSGRDTSLSCHSDIAGIQRQPCSLPGCPVQGCTSQHSSSQPSPRAFGSCVQSWCSPGQITFPGLSCPFHLLLKFAPTRLDSSMPSPEPWLSDGRTGIPFQTVHCLSIIRCKTRA